MARGARLAGKVAFITGGGGGIGRATAERFAEEGAKVVIAEIDRATGEAAAESARAGAGNGGGDAHFIHCDVTDPASVEAAVAATIVRFGKLDVLHNNAGGSTTADGPVTQAPDEEFWRVIRLDLYGTFLCSKLAIPRIIEAGGGSVMMMSCYVGLMGVRGGGCWTGAIGGVGGGRRARGVG
jgi:NAD(P)-dependent dehydrogenase (short-subunit alcohol dehydrogenase family)